MQMPDLRSRFTVTVSLLACCVGWLLLPFTPSFMPGEPLPGKLALLQSIFTWWPLTLLAAFAAGLLLLRLSAEQIVLRRILIVMQWLLTLVSVTLIVVALFEVLFPRPF